MKLETSYTILTWVMICACASVLLLATLGGNLNNRTLSQVKDIQAKIDKIYYFQSSKDLYEYNPQMRDLTKRTGVYMHGDYFCAWTEDQTPAEIYRTVWHELAHHNISIDREIIITDKFILTDYEHFCNGEKQTSWILPKNSEVRNSGQRGK